MSVFRTVSDFILIALSCTPALARTPATPVNASHATRTAIHAKAAASELPMVQGIPLDQVRELYDQEPPHILSHYTEEQPASLRPVLRWDKVKGAVSYEVEITPPQMPSQTIRHIFVPGYNAVLPANTQKGTATWRVRALDFDYNPITAYSPEEPMYVDPQQQPALYPHPLSKFNTGNGATLLYPVYNWVPVTGAASYKVEILTSPDVMPDQDAPDNLVMGRGTSHWFDWYDDSPRMSTQTLYWRVRAYTKDNQPLGVFCPPQPMMINPDKPYIIGTLGDSITHGGGDLSYSPSDWEFSYQHYLDFDTINLGESGDTSEMTRERFEKDVLPFHLKYLIIMTGSNSLRGWTSADDVISDLAAIKEKCLDHDIQPIFLTLPPINPANIKKAFDEPTAEDWRERFQKVNAWIRQQTHIDLSAKIPEDQELPTALGIDGIHLNSTGKQLMAEAINEQWASVTGETQETR